MASLNRLATFVRRTSLPAPPEQAFEWHRRPGAFERLTPPWERCVVMDRMGGIEDGGRVVIYTWEGPFAIRFAAVHRGYQEGRQFGDVQEEGPFKSFVHLHRFSTDGEGRSILEDRIEYDLPFGFLGRWIGGRMVERKLARLFRYRHLLIRKDLMRHRPFLARGPQQVVMSGAAGLLGRRLLPFLTTGGHQVRRLIRPDTLAPRLGDIVWNPRSGQVDASALEGQDVVIHLAGDHLWSGSWTSNRKLDLLRSRVQGTTLLSQTLAKLQRRPRVLVAASAVGSGHGSDFLAHLGREFERATAPARDAGIRVVNLRLGLVSSVALSRLRRPFSLGLGAILGSGDQTVSWIATDDVLGAVLHAMFVETLSGAVDVVSPHPVPQREFAETLARVLGRKVRLEIPEKWIRTAMGESGGALLLQGVAVPPVQLEESSFTFFYPRLEAALRHELGL